MRTALRFLLPLAAAAGAAAAIAAAPVAGAQPSGEHDGKCLNVAPNALGQGTSCPPWETQFATQPKDIHNQSTFLYPWGDAYYGPATVVDWG
ncbi:hypothetical protein [Mycobacterium sp. GA-2829]|uniref:hypothetical protein n=1 Tax=Mycobacterium sp. GA-2829 TaxID=1772283 RepID=UPI00073FF211|nr:hypothetical protein [Mycobacterium sp. GA-2829]KUI39370.1 hypothetical protein AU194_18470 [Mycobacterium sp. GA-2829]